VSIDLGWLPERVDWLELLDAAQKLEPEPAFKIFQALSNSRMDFVRAGKLDKAIERYRMRVGNPSSWPTVRFGLLGSSTLGHLVPGIRLGALRRGLLLDMYVGPYGLYRQELADLSSGLHRFRPDVVCFALDAQHVAGGEHASADDALANMKQCWAEARSSLGCDVIQQTVLPVVPFLMGNNENRLLQSPAMIVQQINHELRRHAEAEGVSLLSVDLWAASAGISSWHDRALWNRSKQEVHPRASNLYGDQVGRLLAALRGRSAKCLVLDLDNTLWGGVIGDDGLEGIVLGQGSAVGEAHLALQRYALQMSRRGVILAVCSKNDEGNALAPFEQHAEMLLRRKDVACFVANWKDKATNIRHIAETLNIGLDSLVFVDDNPVERALVRRELQMVAVPELPEDPAEYVACIADAGYFEGIHVTDEDRQRAELYQANAERDVLRRSTTDMGSFLDALRMELTWSSFDTQGLKRIVQLMNKTNQFNLTTRRYTEADVTELMRDRHTVTLQLRLTDVYGDNGVVALLVGHHMPDNDFAIDTWLMSCRVLGRNVEEATLNILAERVREFGCDSLIGTYLPTAKNGMVSEHYQRLGFSLMEAFENGSTTWRLPLDKFVPREAPMRVVEGEQWKTPMSIAS